MVERKRVEARIAGHVVLSGQMDIRSEERRNKDKILMHDSTFKAWVKWTV